MASSYNQYETRHLSPTPKTTALLVIDMQNHFSSMATPIIPTVNSTISLCRAAGIPIILTRHVDIPPSTTPAPGLRRDMLREWWPTDFIAEGSPASEFLPDLAFDSEKDTVVVKNTYSSFLNTGLEDILDGMGIEEVIVTGVMTNLCCETATREAFVRGYRVFFSADATATVNSELHEATLKNMAFGFAYLVDCGRLASAFEV